MEKVNYLNMINNIISKITNTEPKIEKIDKNLLWKLFKQSANEVIKVDKTKYCKESGCAFKFTNDNKKVVTTILRYFSGSDDFNEFELIKNNSSLSKGVFVFGDVGLGKTVLFKILRLTGRKLYKATGIKKMLFQEISCGNFVNLYMISAKHSKTLDFDINTYYKGKLFIDDLGVEPIAFNSYELLEQVLFERYRNNALSFITTNLKPSEVESRYGKRIASRLPEMCNIIHWKGSDFRESL